MKLGHQSGFHQQTIFTKGFISRQCQGWTLSVLICEVDGNLWLCFSSILGVNINSPGRIRNLGPTHFSVLINLISLEMMIFGWSFIMKIFLQYSNNLNVVFIASSRVNLILDAGFLCLWVLYKMERSTGVFILALTSTSINLKKKYQGNSIQTWKMLQ